MASREPEARPSATREISSRTGEHSIDTGGAIAADDEAYLRRVAKSLIRGSAQDVDDLVQDALLRVAESSTTRVGDRRNWLRTIARRLWYSRLRRSRRIALGLDNPGEREPVDPVSLEDGIARRELVELVRETIAEIAEPYRTVLVLRFSDELEPNQIAAKLNRSRDTVSTQLRRGIALMRKALDRKCGGDRDLWFSGLLPFAPTSGRWKSIEKRTLAKRFVTKRAVSIAAMLLVIPFAVFTMRTMTGVHAVKSAVAVPRGDAPSPEAEPSAVSQAPVVDGLRTERVAIDVTVAPKTPPGEPANLRESESTIDVEVVDASGRPVGNADVEVRHGAGYTPRVRTGSDGSARLEVIDSDVLKHPGSPDMIILSAIAPGFERSRDAVTRLEKGGRISRRLTLPGPETVVEFHILEADRTAGSNRRVWISHPGYAVGSQDRDRSQPYLEKQTTDDRGDVKFAGLGPGEYEMVVFLDGTAMVESRFELDRPGETRREIVLSEPAYVLGTVRDEQGVPVADAVVVSEPEIPEWLPPSALETRTDSDGRFGLAVLPRMRLAVRVRAPGESRIALEGRLSIGPGESKVWDPILKAARSIRLHVTDRDGNALAGWNARLVNVHRAGVQFEQVDMGTTDAEGRATLHFVELENGLVHVSPTSGAEGIPAAVQALDAAMSGEVEISIGSDAEQRGEVRMKLEADAWTLPSSASVDLVGPQWGLRRSFAVSSTAETKIVALLPGRWMARFRAAPSLVFFRTFDIAPGESMNIGTVTLEPPGRLSCRFKSKNGTSADKHAVDVSPTTAWGSDLVVARWHGETTEPVELLEGDYIVVVDGNVSRSKRVHIESGHEIEVVFDR